MGSSGRVRLPYPWTAYSSGRWARYLTRRLYRTYAWLDMWKKAESLNLIEINRKQKGSINRVIVKVLIFFL